MEAKTVTVYQIQENVKDAALNLNGIAEEEETPFFIMNVQIVMQTEESDNFLMANTVIMSVQLQIYLTMNQKKIRRSSFGSTNEPKVHVTKENFVIHNARQSKEKVENKQSSLILTTVSNVESHFKNHKNYEEFNMSKLLDKGKWNHG